MALDRIDVGIGLMRACESGLKVLWYEPIERCALGAAAIHPCCGGAVRGAEVRVGRADIRVRRALGEPEPFAVSGQPLWDRPVRSQQRH